MTYAEAVRKIAHVTSKYNKGKGKAVSVLTLELDNAIVISDSDDDNIKVKVLCLIPFALYYVSSSTLGGA